MNLSGEPVRVVQFRVIQLSASRFCPPASQPIYPPVCTPASFFSRSVSEPKASPVVGLNHFYNAGVCQKIGYAHSTLYRARAISSAGRHRHCPVYKYIRGCNFCSPVPMLRIHWDSLTTCLLDNPKTPLHMCVRECECCILRK